MHDCIQSLAPTLALSREAQLARFRPKTCAEDFANPAWNFPARRTLSCPLASAARRRAATTAPAACCLVDPQPPFEPMTDREEPVMTHPFLAMRKYFHISRSFQLHGFRVDQQVVLQSNPSGHHMETLSGMNAP